MANLKICNLDVIAPVQARKLVIGSEEYDVKPLTVSNFIELNTFRQAVAKDEDGVKGLNRIIKLISDFIPKLPKDIINAMSMEQMQLVVSFLYDEIPDEILKNEPKSEEAEAKESQGN